MDIEGTKILIGAVGVAGVAVIKVAIDGLMALNESKDRKVIRDNIVQQTTLLGQINERTASDTQKIAIGSDRQLEMKDTINSIHRGVIRLQVHAGIAETDTVVKRKNETSQ